MKKIIRIIIITVGICIFIALFKDEFEKNLLKDANYGIPALIEQGKVDKLFLGSSMFRQGIDVKELSEMGDFDYILTYNGNQPVTEEWILRYLIQNGVSIDMLYLDMYAYSAYSEPQISDEKFFMEVGLAEKWQLWKLIPDAGLEKFLRIFVTGNNETLLTWPIQSKLVNQRFIQGGNIAETQGLTTEQIQQLIVPDINEEMNSEQKRSIENIIEVAGQNDIKLIFVETPKYTTVMENADYQRAMTVYEEVLKQNNITYILAKDVWDEELEDTDNFIDLIHLSSKGRQKYTKELLNFIRKSK